MVQLNSQIYLFIHSSWIAKSIVKYVVKLEVYQKAKSIANQKAELIENQIAKFVYQFRIGKPTTNQIVRSQTNQIAK